MAPSIQAGRPARQLPSSPVAQLAKLYKEPKCPPISVPNPPRVRILPRPPISPRATTTRAIFLSAVSRRLDALEPQIGAFVNLNIPAARAAADASTARWRAGKPLSPIDGMPIGIKDVIETADMPTQLGSPLFEGWRSMKDAASVAALRAAGAVILGKTVTTEFAMSFPRGTRNPWNPARTPGGSSSGSAAAAAAGVISAGLGTQVIGSVLRPASYCGAFGFKPTAHALNRTGSHDPQSQSCTGDHRRLAGGCLAGRLRDRAARRRRPGLARH